MGRHEDPSHEGQSKIWLSPLAIVSALGKFDLDPCAAPTPRPWSTAAVHYEPPMDGLRLPWEGRVWLNPPYGNHAVHWLERMAQHGSGIALLGVRTDTRAWERYVWPAADRVLFIRNRVDFYLPCGTRTHRSGHPSALIAYSREDGDRIEHSGIRGALVNILRP